MDLQNTNQNETGSLLALSVEPLVVRACLLESVDGHYRLAGWLSVPRDPTQDVAQQVADTCRRLGMRLGRRLWDERTDAPWLQAEDAIRFPPLSQVAAVASPRLHLRVWLAGLTPSGSRAAQRALAACPVQTVGNTCLSIATNSGQLADELLAAQPEALVISGGYDNPDPAAQPALLLLNKLVGQAVARLPRGQRPSLFYAGNRWAAPQAEALLRQDDGPIQVTVLGNVQPMPGQINSAELATALGYYFWQLCERTPGCGRVARWITSPGQMGNLETGFAQVTLAWMVQQRLSTLHSLYRTDAWWLHVWASERPSGIRLHFAPPQTRPPALADWPPLQLVSGEWPLTLWPPPNVYWHDPIGLAPLVAGIGQVAPLAMMQVLGLDLLKG